MFTLLVQIKYVAKTVQTNAKKTTLIIHFHSALGKVVSWRLQKGSFFLLSSFLEEIV